MTKGLNDREKEAIRALAKSSSEALVATALHMRERESKQLEAKASTK